LCVSLGADSLEFISVEGLLESIDLGRAEGRGNPGHCLGCFTGEYPVPVPGESER
jgi:amidophosphoribosyltransferase